MEKYLGNLPEELSEYGFSKVLAVRKEMLGIKHIFTEMFSRKNFKLCTMIKPAGWTTNTYLEYMTQRMRRIFNFPRDFSKSPNDVLHNKKDRFFPAIETYQGMKNVIVLDFDGVITKKSFRFLYELCIQRAKVVICTANPTVKESWFEKNGLPLPNKIFACHGLSTKMNTLASLSKSYDNVFYVDDEEIYLNFAWVLGINTYKYAQGKIKHYSLIKGSVKKNKRTRISKRNQE